MSLEKLRGQNRYHFLKAARLLCMALALLVAFSALPVAQVQAVTQDEIQALKDKQSQISSSKKTLQDKITAIQGDKAQAMAQKELIEQQIETIRQELEVTNTLIAQLDTQIQEKTAELEAAQVEEARYNALFLQRVRSMEEQGDLSYWAVMFNSASFSDLLDNMTMVNEIMDYDNQVMDELERIRQTIDQAKLELENAMAEQQQAKNQLEVSNAELQEQQRQVDALVEQINAAEAEYQTQLHDMELSASALSKELSAAERQYAAQLAAANSGGVSVGSGGYIWPVAGAGRITSPYGWRNCPFHGREFHSGVDIAIGAGTPIYASKGGVVLISTYHSSYGNYVVVAHPDGGRTLYAHMKSRAATVGSTVTQGSTIGYVGTTGSSTGNHLHFEIWTGNTTSTRVNPMNYF